MASRLDHHTNRPLWPLLIWLLLIALPMACGCEIKDLTEPDDLPDAPESPADPGEPAEEPSRGPGYVVVTGLDHSLPGWVEAEDFAGYINHPDYRTNEVGSAYKSWRPTWAELEPERGQYRWDLVESKLQAAESGGYRLLIHVHNLVCGGGDEGRGVTVPNAVPDWVFDEFELTDDDCVDLGWEWSLRVIPAWRPDIRQAFNDMIRAMGEQGFAAREGMGGMFIHGVSPSLGEEHWLEPWMTERLETRAGFSADVMQDWISSRMDAYADAFGSHTRKLCWVGKTEMWGYSGADYKAAAWELVQYAWSLGMGNRSSIVELYHISLEEPALGQSVDDEGYIHTDETIPPLAHGTFFADENEEYGEGWVWRFGSTDGDWQRYRFAMLRAMQMQMRFLYTHAPAEELIPDLSYYARFAFGKRVETSPDAWAYLKESTISSIITPARVVKNFERWLMQRDVDGGMTVPTERVDREFNAGNCNDAYDGAFYDYTARRTDAAEGQPFMYFDLDDRFTTGGEVLIKVEIRDLNAAVWRLEYENDQGQLASTEAYTGQADGEVRTITFTLDDARFQNGLDHGMDFRIVCNGPDDVTVRWVRLVRTNRPQ